MQKNVDKVVAEADKLIKLDTYAAAWKILMPHKED
jgi:hypothetical protein